jgi:hypothetical protein
VGDSPLPGRLGDPTLEIFAAGSDVPIASNDNWTESRQQIENTGLAPTNDAESAVVLRLDPGLYTAIVRGRNETTGLGLIEIFDLDDTLDPRLVNLSARGFVGQSDDVLIGGVSVGAAADDAVAKVVLRAIGPSLTEHGVLGALSDPTLQLVDANGVLLNQNDNWQESNVLELQNAGLAPDDPRESAIVAELTAGNYTAIVRGKDGAVGVGLFEVYDVPQTPPTNSGN